MRLAALCFLLAPVALSAQSLDDAELCNHIDSPRRPDARPSVQQLTRAAGIRGTFFQGCLALADNKANEAADLFTRVVAADSASAVAHFWLGRAYGDQAQRANVFRQVGLAKKTKSEFDRAAQLDPEFLDAHEGLMHYYYEAPGIMGGSKEKARAQIAEIRRRNPYRAAMLAATFAQREKNASAVLGEYEPLTTQYPDSTTPWLEVIFAQLQQKRWDDAFATVDRFQKAVPNAMVGQYSAGRVAAESGQQLDRGAESLKRYLAYPPKPGEPPIANARWRLGMIYERRGQKDAARAEYQAALQLDPKLGGAKESLAKLR